MIDELRSYPELKPTVLPWPGEVPTHWSVTRLRNLTSRVTSGSRGWSRFAADYGPLFIRIGNLTRSGIDLNLMGVVRLSLPENIRGECQRTEVLPDDLLISITAWIGSVVVVPSDLGEAYVSQHVAASRLRSNEILSRWAAYVVSSPIGRHHGTMCMYGGTKQGLSLDDVKNYPILLPPMEEQRLIVRFLDWHGLRTTKLIRAKKNLIALLDEQKQSVVHRAVTRGLDPNARLKPSGIPWLGDVPEGWEVKRLRNVAELHVSNIDKKSVDGEAPVRLCNYVDVYKNDVIQIHMSFMQATASKAEIERFRLRIGDVILTKDSEDWRDIGVPALVATEADDLVCAYHLALLRPISSVIDSAFLFWRLLSPDSRWQFAIAASGVTRYGLSQGSIKELVMSVPDIVEQRAIAAHLDSAIAAFRSAESEIRREIYLLQEFRSRLIADVVTGKLDVRAMAAGLPESTELEPIDEAPDGEDLDEIVGEPDNGEVAA